MPLLHPAAAQLVFHPDGGYRLNPVTGKEILPLLNSLGDTLVTGVPLKITGKIMHPDSISEPVILPAGRPSMISIRQNTFRVPEDLRDFPVNTDSLRTVRYGVYTSAPILINSTGDTVRTGVPLPVSGQPVPSRQHPRPPQSAHLRSSDQQCAAPVPVPVPDCTGS